MWDVSQIENLWNQVGKGKKKKREREENERAGERKSEGASGIKWK